MYRVQWRITYFVKRASRTSDGWEIEGEPGLGPPQVGDKFSFVLHQDSKREDQAALCVERFDVSSVLVSRNDEVEIRAGDIIGGEVERQR